MYGGQSYLEGEGCKCKGEGQGMCELKNIPLSSYSGVGCACKKESGCRGSLGKEIFGCCLYSPRVMVLGYKGNNSKSINLQAHSC